jgi:hypothetical protein
MVNWMQTWWQVHQSWYFLRLVYRCSPKLYGGETGAWKHRSYAMVCAAALLTPSANMLSASF